MSGKFFFSSQNGHRIHSSRKKGVICPPLMIGYISMFKMVKKMQNSGLEMVAGLTRPLIVACFLIKKEEMDREKEKMKKRERKVKK